MPEEVLTVDKLCSGDRPSIYAAGAMLAHALRKASIALVAVDALGQVVLMSPNAISSLAPPLVRDEDLDALLEDEAIAVMVKEDRPERDILEYLKRRKSRTQEATGA